MIRPLRRRHRIVIPVLFAVLVVTGILAFVYRAAAGQSETLPAWLVSDAVKTP